MSVVTNLILLFSKSEDCTIIEQQLAEFKYSNNIIFQIASIENDKLPKGWYGGSKYMEANIYLGAFNHFNTNDFINHLKSIKWENPQDVQIIVKEENEFKFKLINIFSGSEE